MAGRPDLPLGTWGEINTCPTRNGKGIRAYANYRDFDGRTRQVEASAASESAAKRRLREKLGTRARPTGVDLTRDSRFSALAKAYFDSDMGVSEQTAHQYQANWTRYIKPAMGELRIREVTPVSCSAFLSTLDDRPATKAAVRSQLSEICAAGVRRDLFDSNPAQATKAPATKRGNPRPLTLDEVRELRNRVETHDRKRKRGEPYLLDVVDVMLGTGLRISEVVPLAWADVDFDSRQLRIARHVVRRKGTVTALADHRKGSDDDFYVAMPEFVVSTLLARRTHVTGEWVFESIRTKKYMSVGGVTKQLTAARGDMNFAKSHTLRKTVASLIAAERDAQAAADQLGNTVRVAKLHYIQRNLAAPDLSDVLDLLAPG